LSCIPVRAFSPAIGVYQAFRKLLPFPLKMSPQLRGGVPWSAAFAITFLLASVSGLGAQQTSRDSQNFHSFRELSPVQPRGGSHSGNASMAGALEGPAYSSATAMEHVATNFGKVGVGQTSTARIVTFTFQRSTTLGSIDVVTKGAKDLDFNDSRTGTCKVGASYSFGNTCTVHVTFKPTNAGARDGAVILRDEDGESIGAHPLFASGLAPQIAYLPPVATTPTIGSSPNPVALALDSSENLYIADQGSSSIPAAVYKETLQPGGGYVQTTIGSGWISPSGLTVDGSGDVYVTDSGTGDVYKETPSGNSYTQSLVASGFINPDGVAVASGGDVFVVDFGPYVGSRGGVYRISDLGAPASSQSEIDAGYTPNPAAITADSSGDVFVGSWGLYLNCPGVNCANPIPSFVAEFTPIPGSPGQFSETMFHLHFPTSGLADTVSAIAFDPAGDIYVTDSNLGLGYGGGVFEYSPSPGGYTLAATLFSNDTEAQALALDGNGNVFFTSIGTDGFSNYPPQLYLLDMADVPTLSFPNFTVGSSDPAQTVTIANIGNSPLDFAIPGSGVNPSISNGYTLDSTSAGTCPTVPSTASTMGMLSPATSCTLPVTFAPPTPGNYPGALVLMDDNMLAPGQSGATQTIQLQGAEVLSTDRFVLSAPSTADQGQTLNLTVTAVDSLGDTTTGYAGTVHFTSTDPHALLPADTTLTNGTGTFSVALFTDGAQAITGTDTVTSGISGITGSITVASTHFILSAPGAAFTNQAFNVTVTAVDSNGITLPAYSGEVHFTSSDPYATLPSDATLTNGTGTFSASLQAVGAQTITGTDTAAASITGTTGSISISVQNLVITTQLDDAGIPGNCTVQATPGTGTDSACSLRDAIGEASVLGGASITFDSTKFSASNSAALNTITLGSAGAVPFGSSTALIGPTAGSGANLRNLVTVSGNNASAVFQIGGASVSIRDLAINDAAGAIANYGILEVDNCTFSNNSGGSGAAILNLDAVTVTNSTFTSNSAGTRSGGAISNRNKLSVTGSTFSGNSAGVGGAIDNSGVLFVTNSTFTGNTASQSSGAIYNEPEASVLSVYGSTISGNSTAVVGAAGGIGAATPFTLANSIVSGNGVDTTGSYTDNGGNLVGASSINLAPLGSYGGLTQTMPPLPGSPAICGGTSANATAASQTTDQRGLPFDPLCPAGQNLVDSGAVQTSYALAFTTNPPANVHTGAAISPAPVVELTESGIAASAATNSVSVSDHSSKVGGTLSTSLSSGYATFSNLIPSSIVSGDTLTATLALTPSLNISTAPSSSFQATVPVLAQLADPTSGCTLAGTSATFTWSAVKGVAYYDLHVSIIGPGASDVWASGATRDTSVTVNGIPTNGAKIYVRLYSRIDGSWLYTDSTYTGASLALAELTSPSPGSRLTASSVKFMWSAPAGIKYYDLHLSAIGPGGSDVYSTGTVTGSSVTVNGIPTNGSKIYTRIYSFVNGTWQYTDSSYTEPQ